MLPDVMNALIMSFIATIGFAISTALPFFFSYLARFSPSAQ